MSKITTANYLADADTSFQYATDDADPFDRNDIAYVAKALELHDHSPGRGVQLSGTSFADNTIVTAKIAAGAVTTAKIADAAVTTIKIADSAVVTAKIADNQISSAKIQADAITATHIAASAVGASEIVDGGVGTAELADGAVTNIKIALNSIDLSSRAANGSLTGNKVANQTLNGDTVISPSTVTGNTGTSAIGTDVIHHNRMVTGSLSKAELLRQSGSAAIIPTGSIENSAIIDTKIADGAVTTAKHADASITTVKIADNNVTTAKIAWVPAVHAENLSPFTLTTSPTTFLSTTTPTAGKYLVHVTVTMGSPNSSNLDAGFQLQVKLLNAGGQIGPTIVHDILNQSPTVNQYGTFHLCYPSTQAANGPLSVTVQKSGGTGNSNIASAIIDAQWVSP